MPLSTRHTQREGGQASTSRISKAHKGKCKSVPGPGDKTKYKESRKMILMNLFTGKEWRCRHRKQTCGHSPQTYICIHLQSCPTLCDSVDCSPPSFSLHGVFQARTLEDAAISSSRGSFPTHGLNLCFLHWQMDSLH